MPAPPETPGPQPEPLRRAEGAPEVGAGVGAEVGGEAQPPPAPQRGPGPSPVRGAPVAPPARRRRGYWIPGLIAIAALTAIGVALGAGDLNHSSPKVLDGSDVGHEISLGMQAREGTHSPPDVRCPPAEPVRKGWRFECAGSQSGRPVSIQVVEIDSRGRLRWSLSD